ncbi:T4SS efffector SepA family protein [Blastomonas sp.]|uniref:T4SS efffector SepA family protein n=1 Tax=Blastomonas sp. TaxID=1909299 RepID=UPI0035948A57
MVYAIELPDELFARLQRHAIPLVDTPVSVIERALRALEAGDEDPGSGAKSDANRTFNPAAPPDLSFTTLKNAKIGGKLLPKSDTFWNSVMNAVIVEAAARGIATQDILDMITVNSQAGQREDSGFKYLETAGLSIQGQAANSAWRQAYVIASSFGIELDVSFVWQANEKAAMPNSSGSFFVEGA